MNGIHDVGGMHGFGSLPQEANEPVFHARWEGRAFALLWVVGDWSAGVIRQERELLAPARYLAMSYYERWFEGIERLLIKTKIVSQEEVDGRVAPTAAAPDVHVVRTGDVAAMVSAVSPSSRNVAVKPKFHAGQHVRARNMHPVGHTRLPRYARGKVGTIVRDAGVFVFPDAEAAGLGEKPQHLYSVRFSAVSLWGQAANKHDSVYLDLWDDCVFQAMVDSHFS